MLCLVVPLQVVCPQIVGKFFPPRMFVVQAAPNGIPAEGPISLLQELHRHSRYRRWF